MTREEPTRPPKTGLAPRLRGLVFVIFMYALMAVMGLLCAPAVLIAPRKAAIWSCRTYCRIVLPAARLICGLRWEVRGEIPRGEALIACKHQSFLDIIILVRVLEAPRFVMKRSLLWAPVLGWYARKLGCVAVDRGAKGAAVRHMLRETSSDGTPGQLIIYPQGTRVQPGAKAPYKVGVAALYDTLETPITLAATNAGVFWGRAEIARRPGLAVVEFLDRVPAGLTRSQAMAQVEGEIEAASDRLLAEAMGRAL
ncbi:1-acyl-sn-glycerol-3-phosphate acyltransferase [Albimonas sp. CAU 1670]|uniref:lysophospholipid acyltransferase family protein n=1 Tax=Albimonas sp. CAU 1670 TaxID=3032599 RepID=UPI0023DBB0E4|nr:1-acyl-sn-glycerol-3-phosphate acyltransferase [Albimonas sp. CAU 1670]MDF2233495.1 1-acyl-sn-glycerol-3-phosphate acyltransferase [Albimonas sp. CAU 1670]